MSKRKFSNRALSVAIQKLYLDDSTANVHFVIESPGGKTERIPSHKLLLITYSEVFNAMFNGSWTENDDVKIVDSSPDAFREFLQFFYFVELQLSTEHVDEVLRLGQKYLVAECVSAATQHLTDNVTDENVCHVYGISILAEQKRLQKLCEVIIGLNASAVFKTSGFLECDRQIVSHILQLESLSCSEYKIFNACMQWIRKASKRKTLDKETVDAFLGDSFYDIRFGAMTIDEVNGIFSTHKNLFAAKDRTEIKKMITSKNATSKLIKKQPRKCAWDGEELLRCTRHTSYDPEPHYIDYEHTTFTSNVPILLRALVFGETLQCHYKKPDEVDENVMAKLEIIECGGDSRASERNSHIIHMESEICVNEDRSRRNIVTLSKPVIIKPGITYKIKYPLTSYGSEYCTTFCMGAAKVVKPEITIKFPQSQDRGLLYGIHFNTI